MRIRFKRNCLSYIVSITLVSFLVTLYVIGLRQNKQIGTNFNLKPIRHKVRRDIHDSNKEISGLSKNVEIPQRGNGSINRQKNGEFAVVLDEIVQDSVTANTSNDTSLNVYIVEEHHEVIPYWFGAARRGIIPKFGNTLIHIDGHADLAQPSNVPNYPFFRWPSDRQLRYLMQRNDAFIQAAAMAGMIDRFIWIWPNWDYSNHNDQYVLMTLGLGWAYVTNKGKHKTKEKTFCMCMSNNNYKECRSVDNAGKLNNKQDEGGYKIHFKNCRIKKNVIIEEVHEKKVLSFLSRQEWLANSENIMLDIDEDFYGCGYAIEPLLKSNISYEKINFLEETLSLHMCPLSTAQERESDSLLMDLIGSVRVQRACKIDPKLTNSSKCQKMLKLDTLKHFVTLLNTKITEKNINLCKNISNIHKFTQSLLHQLGKLRIKQLRALQTIGFCSMTSSKTLKLNDNDKFGICFGANTPHNTEILEHVPSKSEIISRTDLLKHILKKLNRHKPKLVTVSRSIRDGYTPRTYFELIERSILLSLNETMDNNLSLHYDKDLIGGKPGWPSRHKA